MQGNLTVVWGDDYTMSDKNGEENDVSTWIFWQNTWRKYQQRNQAESFAAWVV